MVSIFRIYVLTWADMFASFAMYVMMNYLTDVWNLSTIHAAGILNIWGGITQILPIVFACIVDAFMGDYYMLVFSSLAYPIGLGLLTISTPPILGPCSEYKEECIGHTQKVLFFTALGLIAVGMASQAVSLRPLVQQQQKDSANEEQRNEGNKVKWHILGFFVMIIVRIAGAIAIPLIKVAWSVRFNIASICTLLATLLFLSGCLGYKRGKPLGISLSTKTIIRTVPLWLTFIMIGIVLSIGNTYFIEQANRLDRRVGRIKVPIEIFLVIYTLSSSLAVDNGYGNFGDIVEEKNAWATQITTVIFQCVICCITAAAVEIRRLHVIRHHGLLNKPNETIPMSIFWLVPQFVLLGSIDGVANAGISSFLKARTPESMHKYTDHLSKGVLGLGTMASVLSVHIVGKVSERNQKPSWFQPTLNESRFDRYYWMLAALSAVNLFVYFVMLCFYMYDEYECPPNADVENEE